MANTKTLTGSGLRGYSIEFVCTETGTDIASNTSTISYSLKIKSGNYSYADYGTGYSIYINGTRVAYLADNGMDTSLSANSSLTLKTGTTTVTHNNDGTKTVSLSASVSIPEGSYGPGDMSCSGTWDLTTIPRASSMTLPSSFTINSSGSITITAASNTFSHTITYSGLGLSGTVANLNAGVTSTTWTPPTTFYAKLPSATSGTVTLTLTTKSGSTTIGSKSYDTTVNVPSSIKPTAPTVNLQPVNSNTWIHEKGLYVGGYSAVKVTSSATAGSGATISSYTISGSISGSGTPYTSSVLSAGAKSITVTATDSRGRTNSTTTSVTFLTYTYPGLATFSAVRGTYSGGSWTTDVNGNHIRVQAVPSVALSSQGNTASVTVKIGNTNPSATSGNYYYFTSTSATQSYTITGTVSDSVGNTTSRSITVSTVEVPLNINVDTPGVGVGMIAQRAKALELAQSWALVGNGKANEFSYLPFSTSIGYGSQGSAGYVRIATITTLAGQIAITEPFHFRVVRTFDSVPVDLYLRLAYSNNNDPAIESLYYDANGIVYNNTFRAFANRTGPGVYEIYVEKPTGGSIIDVYGYIPYLMQTKCDISYAEAFAPSVPSGAVMATHAPCVSGSYTFTKSSGTGSASSTTYYRFGNVINLHLYLTSTQAVSVGSNLISGTVSGVPLPVTGYATGFDYGGSGFIAVLINSNGTVAARVLGAATPSSTTGYNINMTYLTNQ